MQAGHEVCPRMLNKAASCPKRNQRNSKDSSTAQAEINDVPEELTLDGAYDES